MELATFHAHRRASTRAAGLLPHYLGDVRRSDTLIKHQPVGGETLILSNTLDSVLKFRASRGYHVVILTMVLRLRITMSALPLRADMLIASIDVR